MGKEETKLHQLGTWQLLGGEDAGGDGGWRKKLEEEAGIMKK